MAGEKEQEKGWWRKKGGREDKYIFVLCLRCGRWFSFNVSGEERAFSTMLLSRGDCHQFASWHLNHPLQIWVFEMQIQLRMPRQIKRHTQEWKKHFWRHTFLLLFITRVCTVKHSLSLSLFRRERQHRQIMRLTAKTGILTDYIFIYSFVHPAQRKRKDREVLFLSCPWPRCLHLARCVRLSVFSFFFFQPTRHSEKIWFTFFPLSPSLWRYSYLNINSNASSLAHTLSHIDICIWSLLLALHALLYCVSFNRCKIQYCNLCIQAPKKPID